MEDPLVVLMFDGIGVAIGALFVFALADRRGRLAAMNGRAWRALRSLMDGRTSGARARPSKAGGSLTLLILAAFAVMAQVTPFRALVDPSGPAGFGTGGQLATLATWALLVAWAAYLSRVDPGRSGPPS